MQQRYVGRTGLRVSRLGLGTMTWGRDTDVHEATDQLHDFTDAGGTLIDTGNGYGGGVAEEVLGGLLGDVVARDDVVICARAGAARPPAGSPSFNGAGGAPDTSRRAMLAALDGCLTRLGTDHLDLWLVPGWSPAVPLDETLSALDAAVTSGRARYAGVSNFAGWQLALAAAGAVASGMAGTGRAAPGTPVAVEAEYSLVQRGIERELLPAATALGVGVLAWSPLGRGVLTGKYRTGTPADSRAASDHLAHFVAPYLNRAARRVVDAVVTAGDGLGCSPLEVALAWVRDQPGICSAIVGARTAAQLRASLASDDVELPAEIRAALDEVSAPALGYPERV